MKNNRKLAETKNKCEPHMPTHVYSQGALKNITELYLEEGERAHTQTFKYTHRGLSREAFQT